MRDLLLCPGQNGSRSDHLEAAVDWLCLAHDRADGGGVCASYDLRTGWDAPYPETTGYIVPTLLQAAEVLERPELIDRARAMLDWLLTVQLDNGAFPGGQYTPGEPGEPIVFNTGQILIGLLAGRQQFPDPRYTEAAIRAANWLCDVQDTDGAWRTAIYENRPHTYHTRVAWPLIAWGVQLDRTAYVDAGRRNLNWALAQRHRDGWFDHMAFEENGPNHLHTIAYTLRGLWEASQALAEPAYERAMHAGASVLADHMQRGELAGAYEAGWTPTGLSLCLTGHAQMAILWFKMFEADGQDRYRRAAMAALDEIRRLQYLVSPHEALRGGVRGCYPIIGSYLSLQFLNWATKFFADALMLERRLAADGT